MLASLLDGPLHGYGIIKRAAEMSGKRVRLATGTLHTTLNRLAAECYARLVPLAPMAALSLAGRDPFLRRVIPAA